MAMAWAVVVGLGFTFRAKAEKLVYTSSHHMHLLSPWGEPLLTEESGPLRNTISGRNNSSIQSIMLSDEKMMLESLLQPLSPDFDETAGAVLLQAPGDVLAEKPQPGDKALRPVVFSWRPNHGGRIVRPESVVELNDDDVTSTAEPATAIGVVSRKCPWQCSDNSIECNLMTAVCSLQANRVCVGVRCRQNHLGVTAGS